MRRSFWVPIALGAAILVLAFLCATRHGPLMEADIASRGSVALASAPALADVRVSARSGRDVVLSGTASSEEDAQRAAALATDVYGVRRVVSELDIVPPAPERTASEPPAGLEDAIERLLALPLVEFALESDSLDAADRRILDEVAAILEEWPQMRVEIAGHADSTGADRYNFALSVRRAESVRAYLARSVDANRLSVAGYGSERPIADNATDAGRQRNRRVEFRVVEQSDASQEEVR